MSSSAASYFSYPVTHVVSGLYRRLTEPPRSQQQQRQQQQQQQQSSSQSNAMNSHRHLPPSQTSSSASSQVFSPVRTASPFQPPPLTPLTLTGDEHHHHQSSSTSLQRQLLSRALAEEIRLLVPARLQLADSWRLAYSLDRDGASLATLYDHCRDISARSPRAGYVLVVRDASPAGAVFGAYMTDPPHPGPHYFGTGECFLWRASILPSRDLSSLVPHHTTGHASGSADEGEGKEREREGPPSEDLLELAGLPPRPSADTTHAGRWSTLRGDRRAAAPRSTTPQSTDHTGNPSGASTPDRIRFKAFPYSGVNDYMMFCETGFLSLGGGDGRYGLWLDSSLEKGVSSACQTFGNEPLSDEGGKFDIIGVEVWYVGS
ncbi:hypothetical protein EYZ11_004022 [Aspergillus tanneri]|uniref:Oxidation resistance protein 1 n=1 Tax=Aspergillus tanneri TaxID=1220188 RepID=A0A4S3JM09_9EURO|nr:oxidation resistance protein 1 [Aspergillus tanneri]KAA8645977.1 oxidation resistance protein 1 [Aspergillus tanneri]THC96523.1 hypothetical protein EYZ11_004022 [Aspergillus tanneri]